MVGPEVPSTADVFDERQDTILFNLAEEELHVKLGEVGSTINFFMKLENELPRPIYLNKLNTGGFGLFGDSTLIWGRVLPADTAHLYAYQFSIADSMRGEFEKTILLRCSDIQEGKAPVYFNRTIFIHYSRPMLGVLAQ